MRSKPLRHAHLLRVFALDKLPGVVGNPWDILLSAALPSARCCPDLVASVEDANGDLEERVTLLSLHLQQEAGKREEVRRIL